MPSLNPNNSNNVPRVYSGQVSNISGDIISIETDIQNGLHSFSIIGLPDKAVEESKDRVSSAIKNSGYTSPKKKNQKIVISLFPANIKKSGAAFDLSIAISYLLAVKDIEFDSSDKLFLGELALNGELLPVDGVLPVVNNAKKSGFKEVFVPLQNAKEAALVSGIKIYPIKSLKEITEHLLSKQAIEPQPETKTNQDTGEIDLIFENIKGLHDIKRMLTIAAAGRHNIILYGPPGTGKTLLSKTLSKLLPKLTKEEIIDTTSIHSIAGILKKSFVENPPFRSPHHSSSHVSIIGGGQKIHPGEISLAHNGVLFLDEFLEFERKVMECLREPLEEKSVRISRVSGQETFPANFILVAALNPCPCGNFMTEKECVCSPTTLTNYQKKLSGPIMDRIDMWAFVRSVDFNTLSSKVDSEPKETSVALSKIKMAREAQNTRFKTLSVKTNGELPSEHIQKLIPLDKNSLIKLNKIAEEIDISPRTYHKIIKVARTIADIEGSENVKEEHLLEAVRYKTQSF